MHSFARFLFCKSLFPINKEGWPFAINRPMTNAHCIALSPYLQKRSWLKNQYYIRIPNNRRLAVNAPTKSPHLPNNWRLEACASIVWRLPRDTIITPLGLHIVVTWLWNHVLSLLHPVSSMVNMDPLLFASLATIVVEHLSIRHRVNMVQWLHQSLENRHWELSPSRRACPTKNALSLQGIPTFAHSPLSTREN